MTNSPPKPDLQDEENDLFYFETDHLALKGNADYSDLLKTIFTLEAQRKRAITDYDKVVELHKWAEKEPLTLLEKLKKGENLGVPDLQRIVEVPKINWAKFDLPIPESCLREINSDGKVESVRVKSEELKHKNPPSSKWTHEEQKRLEELLVIYPPEDIELRRFKKISAALGTRTVQQVCSRVQKYFMKLRKAGLPVPGRIPKLYERKKTHKHQRFHYMLKPSTFFPNLDVPVVMNEDEEVPGPSQTSKMSDTSYDSHSSNYLLSNNYADEKKTKEKCHNELDLQIKLLKRVRSEKERENNYGGPLYQHVGFRCDYCKEEPIKGSRWQCVTCQSESIDFCTDCVISQMHSDNHHSLSHKFLVVREDGSTMAFSSDSSTESDSDFATVTNFENNRCDDDDGDGKLDVVVKAEPSDVCDDAIVKREFGFSENVQSGAKRIKTECLDLDGSLVTNESFTETQNVSYDYLHSKLFVDEAED